jgi:hypothetical protein
MLHSQKHTVRINAGYPHETLVAAGGMEPVRPAERRRASAAAAGVA